MNNYQQVEESNRIEGIFRPPTALEMTAHDKFLQLLKVSIEDLQKFVAVYQPNAKLREHVGMDVRVGNYYPPKGGIQIPGMLNALLAEINECKVDPWNVHCQYESIHPFMDGNGRSGRMLWYWTMRNSSMGANLGFLHCFYYQTLSNYRAPNHA